MNCKDCLRQAIVVLDCFHLIANAREYAQEIETDRTQAELAASVRAELPDAEVHAAEPQDRMCVRLIREFAVVRLLGTVVFCRIRRPATLALEILCAEASVAMKHVVRGFLSEAECERLINAAGRVASAPLAFCDARHAALQAKAVADLAARGYLGVAIVDGSLGPHELAKLSRVTAEWPVVVVAENRESSGGRREDRQDEQD